MSRSAIRAPEYSGKPLSSPKARQLALGRVPMQANPFNAASTEPWGSDRGASRSYYSATPERAVELIQLSVARTRPPDLSLKCTGIVTRSTHRPETMSAGRKFETGRQQVLAVRRGGLAETLRKLKVPWRTGYRTIVCVNVQRIGNDEIFHTTRLRRVSRRLAAERGLMRTRRPGPSRPSIPP